MEGKKYELLKECPEKKEWNVFYIFLDNVQVKNKKMTKEHNVQLVSACRKGAAFSHLAETNKSLIKNNQPNPKKINKFVMVKTELILYWPLLWSS